MAIEKINSERFLELAKTHPVLDVRSPGEYKHAHIPGAHSMPLFTDEERKVVGTAYKQQSREQAIKIGLDFFGPKMKPIVEEAEKICESKVPVAGYSTSPENTTLQSKILLVYCWRGGMRSAGIAWLLDLYGFKVYTLVGGYKNYRRFVLDTFKIPFSLRVLGGYTGSGKTELLQALEQKGETIIDLESIANHKGSAFGNIGMPEQPGQEMFENLLAAELRKKLMGNKKWAIGNDPEQIGASSDVHTFPAIWVEDESQRIGLINIPGDLWASMRQSPVLFLDIPFEERLIHITREYGELDKQKLIDAIGRIRERLGGLNAKTAINQLEEGNYLESFRILLEYYDKHYLKALHNRKGINSLLHTIECKSVTPENADLLVRYLQYQPEKA